MYLKYGEEKMMRSIEFSSLKDTAIIVGVLVEKNA